MRLQRGIVLSLLASTVAFGACKSSTSPNPCADFQGTWNTTGFVYTANADTTVSFDLRTIGAAISLVADDNCNYTGTANIPTITTGTMNIGGSFTLNDAHTTLTLADTTAVGAAINNTYNYTLSGNNLTLVNPSTTFDFTQSGTPIAATATLTFLRQ